MLRRIGLWTLMGAAIAFCWFLYFTQLTWGAYHGGAGFEFGPGMETLVNITAPVRPLFGRHYAITWYWSIVMNAGLYALIGLAVESVRAGMRWATLRPRH